ncbi:hypothetical protein EYF80_018003 [Liparis tanakae]|uniref:Uncharacterized protein n=1 Tax=Liparis tanakae TaxID=230148 RepID=A0A4Z2I3I8_9TELE|nr:hypothetical protein EYF80_018003 [Liparis tanakae]
MLCRFRSPFPVPAGRSAGCSTSNLLDSAICWCAAAQRASPLDGATTPLLLPVQYKRCRYGLDLPAVVIVLIGVLTPRQVKGSTIILETDSLTAGLGAGFECLCQRLEHQHPHRGVQVVPPNSSVSVEEVLLIVGEQAPDTPD